MTKRIITFAVVTLLVILSCSRDKGITQSATTDLVPQVLWKVGGVQVSPDEVDSVRLTVSSPDLSSDKVGTFAYSLHEGLIENLPTGISLTLTIEGLDGNGNVVYSGTVSISNLSGDEFSVVVDAGQVSPLPPDSLKAIAKSSKTIQLTWQDFSSNETMFVIERKSASGTYDSIAAVLDNVTSYIDTGLTASTAYSYRIRAINLAGSSDASDSADVTTLSVNANSVPYFDISTADLSDTLVVGQKYARKLSATDENGDSLTFSAISTLTLTADDSISWTPGIGDTGTNAMWVKAEDDSGTSDSIGFIIFVTDTTDTGTAVDTSGITVSITNPAFTGDTLIQATMILTLAGTASSSHGVKTVQVAVDTATRTGSGGSFSFTGLPFAYLWNIITITVTDSANQASVNTFYYYYGVGSLGNAPTPVEIGVTSTSATIGWVRKSGCDRYVVYMREGINGTYDSVGTTTDTFYTATGLSAGTEYYLAVDCRNLLNATGMGNGKRVLTASAPNVNLDSGLVAYYPFDGNANDESGNGNDGTVNGAVLVANRFGFADRAYCFSDAAHKIDATAIANTGAMTVVAWIKLASLDAESYIVGDFDANVGPFQLECQPPDNLGFALRWGSGTPAGSSMAIANGVVETDKWLFVCATHEQDATITLYVDGQTVTKTTESKGTPSFPISGTGLNIGYLDSAPGPLDGVIDDIRIYNRALDSAEIDSLYREGGLDWQNIKLDSGLVAYYPFAGNANDSSTYSHNGSVGGAQLTTDRFGAGDNAYTFDGSDYISITATSTLRITGDLSVSLWMKPNTASIVNDVMAISSGDSNSDEQNNILYRIGMDTNGRLFYSHEYSTGIGQTHRSTDPMFLTDQWYHVCLERSAGQKLLKVFVDGEYVESITYDYNPTGGSISPFWIGKWANATTTNFIGDLDDIRIYNRQLNVYEVVSLYREGGWIGN